MRQGVAIIMEALSTVLNESDRKILEPRLCRGQGSRLCTHVRLKLFAVGLLTICLTACSVGRLLYRPRAQGKLWYRQDTKDSVAKSDLEACRSAARDTRNIGYCMQAKGYLLIPRAEAELLMVKSLQKKGLNWKEIAARLGWNRKKVLSYMDEGYELPRSDSLGRQPVEILAKVGKPAAEHLIAALKDNDPLVRRHAAQALGEIKEPRAVKPLVAALKDTNSLIRRHAVKALGKIKDPRAVKPLIAVLNDKDAAPHIRAAAAEALGWFKEPRVVESLVSALKDEHWNVRSRAARALGRIKDPRAVEHLVCAMKDEDAAVRGHAADALGELRDEHTVEPLIDALRDRNGDVRGRVAQALKKITGRDCGE
ncbi:MAG: HEAT repeat domain-containing protein [Desulfobacterales bacterium]|nr:HEAT repeat domain-containing protein [Desulfobacterales bacterium]